MFSMTDNLTVAQRSYTMSRIKSKWTRQERMVHNFLNASHIRHKMHPNLLGRPDLIIPDTETAVFLNGCFWHKCKKCYTTPKTRVAYWKSKTDRNVKRDKNNTAALRCAGWKVMILWEHEIKDNWSKVEQRLLKVSR